MIELRYRLFIEKVDILQKWYPLFQPRHNLGVLAFWNHCPTWEIKHSWSMILQRWATMRKHHLSLSTFFPMLICLLRNMRLEERCRITILHRGVGMRCAVKDESWWWRGNSNALIFLITWQVSPWLHFIVPICA